MMINMWTINGITVWILVYSSLCFVLSIIWALGEYLYKRYRVKRIRHRRRQRMRRLLQRLESERRVVE